MIQCCILKQDVNLHSWGMFLSKTQSRFYNKSYNKQLQRSKAGVIYQRGCIKLNSSEKCLKENVKNRINAVSLHQRILQIQLWHRNKLFKYIYTALFDDNLLNNIIHFFKKINHINHKLLNRIIPTTSKMRSNCMFRKVYKLLLLKKKNK